MLRDTAILQQKLGDITDALPFLIPEAVLAGCLLLLLLTDLVAGKKGRGWLIFFSLSGFLLHLGSLFWQWQVLLEGSAIRLLGMLYLDGTGIMLRGIFSLSGLLAVLMSMKASARVQAAGQLSRLGEYYVLLFGLLLGTSLMVMSANLLMLFLAVETVSICSYILTNFSSGRLSAEAGIKYLLFGGVSAGLMLYGMSWLYGFSGSLMFTDTVFAESLSKIPLLPLLLALLLLSAGLMFKISAVPFHLWTPDVYQGAPLPVVAVFSVAPKVAGLAVLLHFSHLLESLGQLMIFPDWQWVMGLIAITSIVVGNFAAFSQRNARRMLAYSSIAHSGFMLIGIITYSELGTYSLLFYAAVYLLMNFAAFLLVSVLGKMSGSEEMASFRGLGLTHPLPGVLMVIVMISLSGLPPTAGFTAKLLLFSAVWEAFQDGESSIMLPLLLIGLLNTVASLFYYLKIPYYLFFRSPVENRNSFEEKNVLTDKPALGGQIMAVMLSLPLLLLFFKADWLLNLIRLVHF